MNTKAINRYIKDTYENGLKNLTLSDFRELERVYEDLKIYDVADTICSAVAEFLEKQNCKVIKKAISYKITV